MAKDPEGKRKRSLVRLHPEFPVLRSLLVVLLSRAHRTRKLQFFGVRMEHDRRSMDNDYIAQVHDKQVSSVLP